MRRSGQRDRNRQPQHHRQRQRQRDYQRQRSSRHRHRSRSRSQQRPSRYQRQQSYQQRHREPKDYRESRQRSHTSRSNHSPYSPHSPHSQQRQFHQQIQRSYSKRRSEQSDIESNHGDHQLQELQQNIRISLRKNELQFDAQLHQTFLRMPEIKQQQLNQQARSTDKIHQCILVRQLFISGLNDINQYTITQLMGKYGEIQNIQIIKDFAFVRYYRVQDASNACADYHNINASVQPLINANFKIFFADHLKRWGVVSNHRDYQITQYLVPVVYVSIKNDPQFANQKYLSNIFRKFGFIRNLQLRKNQFPGPKIHVNVQYQTLEQALRARQMLKNHKQKFGQKKSQITILIDSQKITRIFPNVSNQIRYQKKRLQGLNSGMMPPGSGSYSNMPTGGSYSSMPVGSGSYSNMTALQPYQARHYQPHHQMQAPQMMNPIMNPIAPAVSNFQTQDIFAMLDKLNDKKTFENNYQQVQHQVDEESDWTGFFTRNKQFKVEVDFNRIHKDVSFELESVLNVSYRGDIHQAMNRTDYILAGKFKAANSLNTQQFNSYVKYFSQKNRGGIVFTKSYLVYLIPPKEQLNLPYQVGPNELLALFFKIPN